MNHQELNGIKKHAARHASRHDIDGVISRDATRNPRAFQSPRVRDAVVTGQSADLSLIVLGMEDLSLSGHSKNEAVW